ncbi:tetratricopeptide repeat protein [Nonomuraea sp. NPDC003727]
MDDKTGTGEATAGEGSGDVEFRLLGSFEVRAGGRALRLGGPRQEKVLAALLLNANTAVSTSALVDAMWDDDPPETAREQVHNAVATLRRKLGPLSRILVTEGRGYRLDIAEEQVDASRFSRAIEAARRQRDASAAVTMVSEALELWRGPALCGMTGRVIEAAATRMNEHRLSAWELLIDHQLELGEVAGLVPDLAELAAANPLRESLVGRFALVLAHAGRQSEALEVYERTRVLLADELGVDPSPELRAVHARLLRDEARPAPRERRDIRPDARPNVLPYDIADFTGRTREIDRLLGMTAAPATTAIVITAVDGMPGVGKTALAVHAAHLLAARYPDGQLFIDLHGHTPGQRPLDPFTALDLLLRDLGHPPEQIPDTLEKRIGLWRAEVGGKSVLVVLDNAKDAAQVRPLLPGTPSARVLVTSRRRLTALEGATSFSLEQLTPAEAAELFVRIAGADRTAARPELVDQVVAMCGLLPLAIRIAASRFAHRPAWTLTTLLDRLRDERRRLAELTASDRGVIAAFTVSYQHLSDAEQRLFRMLGVHPGADFDAYGVASLIGVDVAETERLLENLLDVHLLIQLAAGRYQFHDLIRHHARMLAEQEESEQSRLAAVRRLVDYSLRLGHACETLINPGRQLGEMDAEDHRSPLPVLRTTTGVRDLIRAEHRNLTAVIGRAEELGLLTRTWRLSATLGPLLQRHGHGDEALECYGAGLRAARAAGDRAGEATVCRHLGVAYIGIGRYGDALEALSAGLALEETQDGTARLLSNMGIALIRIGRFEEALGHLDRALDLLKVEGTPHDLAMVLTNIGVAHTQLGRYAKATDSHLRALEIQRPLGNPFAELLSLVNVGWVATLSGDLETASDHLERGLALSRQIGAREVEARALFLRADCLRRDGKPERALEDCRQALVFAREMGDRDIEGSVLNVLGRVHQAMGDVEAAADCFTTALRVIEDGGQAAKSASAHEGLGEVCWARGDQRGALTHWERSLTIATAAGLPVAENLRHRVAAARQALAGHERPSPPAQGRWP